MSQNQTIAPSSPGMAGMLALTDFGALQERYRKLSVADRARTALDDAEPALKAAEALLKDLASHAKAAHVIEDLRKNMALTGKMRASEAKTTLMDTKNDFIEATRHKLAAWRKTMERLAGGEGIVKGDKQEFIPNNEPVAAALISMAATGGYLAIIQLVFSGLAKADKKHAGDHQANVARIRRAATLISDCETASGIGALVH